MAIIRITKKKKNDFVVDNCGDIERSQRASSGVRRGCTKYLLM